MYAQVPGEPERPEGMDRDTRTRGSVLLLVVFVVALLATMVMGMLEINTEEIQVMQNNVYAAEAQATAEAGLEDALKELRDDKTWHTGFPFPGTPFNGGSYTVTVGGGTVTSVGTTSRGYTARVEADYHATGSSTPYAITIEALRINE